MGYFVGIDIGSTTIKIAIIDENKNIVAKGNAPTGSRFNQNAIDALDLLLFRNKLNKEDILYTVSTGYGRKLFKDSDDERFVKDLFTKTVLHHTEFDSDIDDKTPNW
ncbi:MAG: hypothetical protein L3J74_13875 [Bacteroidales bacterium]|nr:hypothetical protein [Bacteroidales bacterium]